MLDGAAPQNTDLPPRSTGTIMRPAPCALAISHDQAVRSQKSWAFLSKGLVALYQRVIADPTNSGVVSRANSCDSDTKWAGASWPVAVCAGRTLRVVDWRNSDVKSVLFSVDAHGKSSDEV